VRHFQPIQLPPRERGHSLEEGEGAQKLEGVKVLAGSHVNVRPRGVVDLGRKTGYELFVELGIEANVDSLLI